MTVRVDYDALVVLRTAAAKADLTAQQWVILGRALALTDPDTLLAIEAAGADSTQSEN